MAFTLGAAMPATPAPSHPAAGSGAQYSINAAEIERFLARVLPTPGPGRVVSINTYFKKPTGESSMPGQGFDSFKAAANHIAYWLGVDIGKNGKPQTDYYFCVSVQAGAVQGQTRTGRPMLKTSRRQSNAVALKAFFIDLDSKPEKGGYKSKQEAFGALLDLVKSGDCPAPTLAVETGNGVHVYWTLDTEVPAKEWQELAEGFQNHLWHKGIKLHLGDSFLADSARLLRPPGTYHCKDKNNPIQTRVIGTPLPHDYAVSTFAPYKGTPRPHHVASVTRLNNPAGGTPAAGGAVAGLVATGHRNAVSADDLAAAGLAPAGAPLVNDMAMGVAEAQAQPVDFAKVVANCAVLADVAARGGAGDPEPFWRAALYAASFAPDGREWAHKLSKGDSRYNESETDAKFNTIIAQRQRAQGKHGWPTCAEFNKHSAKCGECEFAGRVKTPMHTGKDDSDLPEGYYRQAGTIWRNILVSSRKDAEPMPTCVFAYGIRDAFIESTPDGPQLNAEVHVRHHGPQRLRVTLRDISVWRERALAALSQVGITVGKQLSSVMQEFFVDYVRRLQEIAAMTQPRPAFGWTTTRAGRPGFGVGQRIWRPDGSSELGGAPDKVLEANYAARGDIAAWNKAALLVINSGRLDLQVIIASAFAAPLVKYTGLSGLLLSAYSPKSGVQKSTAMQIAQAVWGHPKTAMQRLDDTGNSVAHKLGTIRHLPVYWDELNLDSERDTFARLAFVLTQGTEKSRLTDQITQRQGGSWATMLVSASNFSVQDEMVRKTRNTTAGLNRVLEFVVRPGSPSQLISNGDATLMLGAMQDNYGRAGERYAAMLAREEKRLGTSITGVIRMLEAALGNVPEERFWMFTVATILLGASMARAEGILAFDLPALRDYLLEMVREQRRAKRAIVSDTTSAEYVADILTRYIAFARTRNACLETDKLAPVGVRGRAAPLEMRMPSEEARRSLRAPIVHLAREQGAARILKHEFHEWLNEQRIPPRHVIDSLTEHAGLAQHRITWAAGTEYNSGQTWVYDVVLTDGPAPHNAVGKLFGWGPMPLLGQTLGGTGAATHAG